MIFIWKSEGLVSNEQVFWMLWEELVRTKPMLDEFLDFANMFSDKIFKITDIREIWQTSTSCSSTLKSPIKIK